LIILGACFGVRANLRLNPYIVWFARSAGAGLCTVLGTPLLTTPEYAALANGAAAHSIELDDTHQAGSIHVGVVIYPTAIAISEQLGHVDADRFVAAVVAGYEMAARVAMAV
jgi:2-methylcitrate dehydratase PrpD